MTFSMDTIVSNQSKPVALRHASRVASSFRCLKCTILWISPSAPSAPEFSHTLACSMGIPIRAPQGIRRSLLRLKYQVRIILRIELQSAYGELDQIVIINESTPLSQDVLVMLQTLLTPRWRFSPLLAVFVHPLPASSPGLH